MSGRLWAFAIAVSALYVSMCYVNLTARESCEDWAQRLDEIAQRQEAAGMPPGPQWVEVWREKPSPQCREISPPTP
jgi:hypothetical protein